MNISRIDSIILAKFQAVVPYLNVIYAFNASALIAISLSVHAFGFGLFSALNCLIYIVGSSYFSNIYSQQEEGHKNELYEILYTLRVLVVSFLIIDLVLSFIIGSSAFFAQIFVIIALYLISTDKMPKPPEKTSEVPA